MVGTPEQEERREAAEKEQWTYAHVGRKIEASAIQKISIPSGQRPLQLPPWVSDAGLLLLLT